MLKLFIHSKNTYLFRWKFPNMDTKNTDNKSLFLRVLILPMKYTDYFCAIRSITSKEIIQRQLTIVKFIIAHVFLLFLIITYFNQYQGLLIGYSLISCLSKIHKWRTEQRRTNWWTNDITETQMMRSISNECFEQLIVESNNNK